MEGYKARIHNEARVTDSLNFVLGQYIISAIHNPKKYPHEPYMKKQEKKNALVATTANDRVRIAKMLHGKK